MAEAIIESPKPSTPTEELLVDSHIPQRLTVENSIIIWLDPNLNINNDDNHPILVRLQQLVNLILCFSDSDQCIDCITDIKNEKIFLIVTGSVGKNLVPLMNSYDQIDSIYIYCTNKDYHEKWANKEKKIKGIFTKVQPIYDAIRRDIRQCEDDLVSFNILSSTFNQNEDLNLSDQLFISTQLMKEILFEIEYQPDTKQDLINICSLIYQNNIYQLDLIQKFNDNYQQSRCIYWYTRECFISSILNKAFRIGDIEILLKTGFFIQDLHQEIQSLHKKLNKQNNLIVYRGQGISEENFQKILDNQHGFLSFNNFLLTTTDKDLSLIYVRAARNNHQLIGVQFQIEIDRTKPLFIPLDKISYYSESEKEVLFSIHTIFRIDTIHQIDNDLWQIQLKLTNDENEELKYIREFIRKDIDGKNQQERLGVLMNKLQIINGLKSQVIDMEIEPTDEEECAS